MLYIGVRGHRGSGKNTVSFLIGEALEYYISHNKSFKGFSDQWEELVRAVRSCGENDDPCELSESSKVYYESFATTPKVLVSMITGIDMKDINDDWCKDNTFINLHNFDIISQSPNGFVFIKTFEDYISIWHEDCWEDFPLVTAQEFFKTQLSHISNNYEGRVIQEDVYMSLREFIIYYGKYCSQFALGKNVWVKSLVANQEMTDKFYSNVRYKIFTDVKFPSEVSYIKDNGGIIICASRKDHNKGVSALSDALKDDHRIDFTLDMSGDIEDKQKMIEEIITQILNK